MAPRIGVLVVAYNAATTLAKVLDRIPVDFRPRITKVLVSDDHSSDSTYLVGLGYQKVSTDLPLEVIRSPRNLGYGGNQKVGYSWAIEHDLDIVVMLHGDGQYAPEILADIVAPIERGEADAVFGSRMMEQGAARKGGMPLYKYVGNRILTKVENTLVGTDLSEWHSGYRAYSVSALRDIPYLTNDDGFNFDTQIIVQLLEARKRIVEIPIPTYYGDEICYVDGVKYAREVVRDVARYRVHKMGFGSGELAFASTAYDAKYADTSSHRKLLALARHHKPGRVLDLGCADGSLAQELRDLGHTVTGVDLTAADGVKERVDHFIAHDLDRGLPPDLGGPFDLVIAADVLEHLRRPQDLLVALKPFLAPGAAVLASVPNFAHWYPRSRVTLGKFGYDRRGILDNDHVRFFTRAGFRKLVVDAGYRPGKEEATGLPLEVLDRGDAAGHASASLLAKVAGATDRFATAAWPTMFGYQFVCELTPLL